MVETTSPHGVDLSLLPPHLTRSRWLFAQVLTAVLIGLAIYPPTGRHLALASSLPIVLLACCPLAMALLILAGTPLFLDRRLVVPRVALLLYAPATIAAVGACSHLSVSPAYGMLLWIPPCWGVLFPANRMIALSIAVSPVALRVMTVPDATPRSLAIAATIGIVTTAAYLAFSWRRLMVITHRQRELSGEVLGAPSVERAADRWTAMRLHDRLSGVLMLAAARDGHDDSIDLSRLVVERARATLDDPRRGSAMNGIACGAAIAELARSLAVDAKVVRRGGQRASVAWRELHDLLVELVANHARHGRTRGALRIHLAMRAGVIRARVSSATSSPLSTPEGRGRRNLALRAEALGGRVRWTTAAQHWSVAVSLPAIDASPGLLSILVGVEVLAHVVALLALATTSISVAVVFGASTIALAALQALDLRRDRHAHDARRAALRLSIDDAAAKAIARTRAALTPLIDRLDGATAQPAAQRRAAISDLSGRFSELLVGLEAGDDVSCETGRADRV